MNGKRLLFPNLWRSKQQAFDGALDSTLLTAHCRERSAVKNLGHHKNWSSAGALNSTLLSSLWSIIDVGGRFVGRFVGALCALGRRFVGCLGCWATQWTWVAALWRFVGRLGCRFVGCFVGRFSHRFVALRGLAWVLRGCFVGAPWALGRRYVGRFVGRLGRRSVGCFVLCGPLELPLRGCFVDLGSPLCGALCGALGSPLCGSPGSPLCGSLRGSLGLAWEMPLRGSFCRCFVGCLVAGSWTGVGAP